MLSAVLRVSREIEERREREDEKPIWSGLLVSFVTMPVARDYVVRRLKMQGGKAPAVSRSRHEAVARGAVLLDVVYCLDSFLPFFLLEHVLCANWNSVE